MNSSTEHTCIKDDGGTPNRKCEACAAEPRRPTDTDLLDWLERQHQQRRYTGLCIFQWSTTGRGWRLHETSEPDSHPTVRAAIAAAMDEELE